eukprot:CAMPEP_0178878670 /NCGR_PEP_ID=MMETSP0747-20121128/11523_1 /TAXON_ID=913974 /ORGANISM="Nitzschia punctata, Strain CCMP561" /LENGTH=262 /DNA_ID=CAMNT_0020546451 /DNA_START=23 /DNA_END=811 /DNA_ORIENTATION=-
MRMLKLKRRGVKTTHNKQSNDHVALGGVAGLDDSMSTAGSTSFAHDEADKVHRAMGPAVTVTINTDDGETKSSTTSTRNLKRGPSRRSSLRLRRNESKIDILKLAQMSKRSEKREHDIWTSNFATKVYIVLFTCVVARSFWVLQLISLLILYHMFKLLFSWFLFVKEAREIREFQKLALWWIRFGLDKTTKSIQGDKILTMMTAFTLGFWNSIGMNFTLNFVQEAGKEHRQKFINNARDSLNRSQMSYIKMQEMLKRKAHSN